MIDVLSGTHVDVDSEFIYYYRGKSPKGTVKWNYAAQEFVIGGGADKSKKAAAGPKAVPKFEKVELYMYVTEYKDGYGDDDEEYEAPAAEEDEEAENAFEAIAEHDGTINKLIDELLSLIKTRFCGTS